MGFHIDPWQTPAVNAEYYQLVNFLGIHFEYMTATDRLKSEVET